MDNPITMMIIRRQAEKKEEPIAEKSESWPEGIKGEEYTGYEDPDDRGEFECENCSYYQQASLSCNEEHMKAKSKRARTESGNVIVSPEGCCSWINRVGRKDTDKD